MVALGAARGALSNVTGDDAEMARRVLDLTATASVAQALGMREPDLAIIWEDHLSEEELRRILPRRWDTEG
jgi:hypothetical protein